MCELLIRRDVRPVPLAGDRERIIFFPIGPFSCSKGFMTPRGFEPLLTPSGAIKNEGPIGATAAPAPPTRRGGGRRGRAARPTPPAAPANHQSRFGRHQPLGYCPCPKVDMGAYEFQEGETDCCPWDCGDGDGSVDIDDFLAVIAQWGGPGSCDFDGDDVDIDDFLAVIANWGVCP